MAGRRSAHVGQWGGNGGSHWDDGNNYNGIKYISMYCGHCIDSIQVWYDRHGEVVAHGKHGGNGGGQVEINLQYPDEYLVGINGHYGNFQGHTVIRSLTFTSNRRTFGPYGHQVGTSFSLPISGGHIVGLTGRSGIYLDAIGCHVVID